MHTGDTRVLVVDDEDFICKLIERMLADAGYRVTSVGNGYEALDRLAQGDIDLVLLDIMMPQIDGFKTLDLIRERYDVPVIMLTAKTEASTLRDAVTEGADDYVRKPFSKLELLARVKARLRRYRVNGHPEKAVHWERP